MKTQILSLATILLSTSFASADIIKCNFTEPFYDTTYSMAQQSLTIRDMENKIHVIKNVSFQIVGPAKFELVDKKGQVLHQLTLSMDGSDGMSDIVYPYEVKDLTMSSGANNGIGGCSSNKLPAIEGENE